MGSFVFLLFTKYSSDEIKEDEMHGYVARMGR
jgi:hypothetical protein